MQPVVSWVPGAPDRGGDHGTLRDPAPGAGKGGPVSIWKWGSAVLVVVGAAVLFLRAPGETLDPVLAARPGAATYQKYCLRCHGSHGDGAKASRMAERGIDFTSPAFADTADLESVRRTVTRGRGKMKGYGDKLTPGQIDTLARFVLDLAPPWE